MHLSTKDLSELLTAYSTPTYMHGHIVVHVSPTSNIIISVLCSKLFAIISCEYNIIDWRTSPHCSELLFVIIVAPCDIASLETWIAMIVLFCYCMLSMKILQTLNDTM